MKLAKLAYHSIIKVQIPIYTTDKVPKALILNEDQSFDVHYPVTYELRELMRGRNKAFFYAHVDKKGVLFIEAEAPWTDLW